MDTFPKCMDTFGLELVLTHENQRKKGNFLQQTFSNGSKASSTTKRLLQHIYKVKRVEKNIKYSSIKSYEEKEKK
ncbi:Uncharacterized protein TCM_017512 [Theobroma cacao]|uniref:Uncharacterized protein n=1 Tax=Theobroma cacao TaxID=3641 RepID=A0A061EL95_THECC|nr:Uncharacterized protein TCM_017512 [Theobroma cacao]